MPLIKILLIDDDKNYYTLIERMLVRDAHQFKLEWVANPDLAKVMVSHAQHDVYLMDYHLGSANGLELMRELKDLGVTSPFILLTGNIDQEFELRVLEAGAADYIDKAEIKPNSLRRTIRYALQRSQDLRALRASEERFRMMMEDASDGILIFDASGTIQIVNSRACEMAELPGEALIGQPLQTLLHPANALSIEMLSAGQPLLVEAQLRRASGTLPIEVSAKIISSGQFQCIFRDITHRKAAEAERDKYIQRLTILRMVDEEINQSLNTDYVLSLALDAAVRLSAANAGFIGLLENEQLRQAQTIGGYSVDAINDYLQRSQLYRHIIDHQEPLLITNVTTIPDYIPLIPRTEAQMLIPLVSYKRLLGVLNLETNKAERFTPEAFDFLKLIASRLAAAIENAQLYQLAQDQLLQVQELEQIKSDMIRIAAHDLRNPVGVIIGYLELFEWSLGDTLTEKQRSQIDAMVRAARRMAKITTDILSLERIEKLQLEPTQVLELKALVQEVYDEMVIQARLKQQHLHLTLPEASAINIYGDSAQLREAIANLISNAVKYTPDEGNIEISLDCEENQAVFKVVDTGYGIPLDQQANLFQPFFRAASEETATIDGTGLGLHLVKNIITRHNGQMIFNSVYSEGSTFGFRIPLA